MAQCRDDRRRTEAPQPSVDVQPLEDGDTSGPLPGSLEEFLLDRFGTTLEDPRTGRKVRYTQ
jgi:hypothetical protein